MPNATGKGRPPEYLPMRTRGIDTASSEYRNDRLGIHVVLRPAQGDDLELIAQWLTRAEIYRPLGLKSPVRHEYVVRRRLPFGLLMPVEVLTVLNGDGLRFGFAICYELSKVGVVEVDVAIVCDARRNDPNLSTHRHSALEAIHQALFHYLFESCGAKEVRWHRRRKGKIGPTSRETFEDYRRRIDNATRDGQPIPQESN